MSLKKEFNAVYRDLFLWVGEVHRDCHAQPFADLQTAWAAYTGALSDNDSESVEADPQFINAAANDFRVAGGSPAVDGSNAFLPTLGAYGKLPARRR